MTSPIFEIWDALKKTPRGRIIASSLIAVVVVVCTHFQMSKKGFQTKGNVVPLCLVVAAGGALVAVVLDWLGRRSTTSSKGGMELSCAQGRLLLFLIAVGILAALIVFEHLAPAAALR